MPATNVRVVVVDSYPLFVFGLQALIFSLEVGIDVVGVATSGEQALVQIEETLPDVAVVVSRSQKECLEFVHSLRETFPTVRVIMLADSFKPRQVREALRLGVSAYLSRNLTTEDLVNAIRTVKVGEVVMSPLASACLMLREGEEEAPLSECELEILRLVAEGLDNLEIAQRMHMSKSTLKRNLHCVLDKLGVQNRVQAAVRAARQGLI
jgi:DNA-binding NarL/FixJ family response regulator